MYNHIYTYIQYIYTCAAALAISSSASSKADRVCSSAASTFARALAASASDRSSPIREWRTVRLSTYAVHPNSRCEERV